MYGYLIGDAAILLIWLILFLNRKDLRKQILAMSILIGILSMATNYYLWNIDWWHPFRIGGLSVGIEDFLGGFASGGIIASAYEEIFKKRLYRRNVIDRPAHAIVILALLAQTTSFLFWGWHLTSFIASSIAMALVALFLFFSRKDLVLAGLFSGILMVIFSLVFYRSVLFVYPNWVSENYNFQGLSGNLLLGIPIEELVFWLLAGFVFGPFYEYWQGEGLRSANRKATLR